MLNGFPVSPGVVVGEASSVDLNARICFVYTCRRLIDLSLIAGEASLVMDAQQFDQMKPGTILVCPMTSPAWTQLFAHATGLVTDMGAFLQSQLCIYMPAIDRSLLSACR